MESAVVKQCNETNNQMINILIVEDDDALREALSDTIDIAGFNCIAVNSGENALKTLQANADVAMVVTDVNMGGMSGHDLLDHIRQDYPHLPVLLITAYGSVSQSVAAIQRGAVDYLVKPFDHHLLVEAVNRHARHQVKIDEQQPVAVSPSSQQLLQLAQRAAVSDSTILIVGESGSGKEVLARYIHQQSKRADKPFVAVNCAAIPENMLESILFGHEKGAYTGAYSSAPGKFELANGGTLLLDEISEMDLGLQAKLLRVLQEREVERLGGRKTIELNVRVIATSNRNLLQEVQDGNFREDLYYRLNILPLQWEPLRKRPEDILPLAQRLLQRHAQKQNRTGVWLDDDAKQALVDYPWPGNVRELDNIMQRALILQTGTIIQGDDLGLSFGQEVLSDENNRFSLDTKVPQNCHVAQPPETPVSNAGALGEDLKQHEFDMIVTALRKERGSRKNTAQRLGLSPRTLRYKIARLRDQGLDVAEALRQIPF